MLYVTTIEAAKARDKQYKLTDVNGLHLLINPNGSKLWRFRYRFGGKQLMLSLGALLQPWRSTVHHGELDFALLVALQEGTCKASGESAC